MVLYWLTGCGNVAADVLSPVRRAQWDLAQDLIRLLKGLVELPAHV